MSKTTYMINISTNYYESSHMFHGNMSIIMGTRLDVILLGQEKYRLEAAWNQVQEEVIRLDKMLNRFDPESEIYALNQTALHEPAKVNDELWHILLHCKQYYTLTEGYFDISLKDYSRVVLEQATQTVLFDIPDIYLDLGGYAKGYALNKMREILQQEGITQALINFGNSSVLGIGSHPYGDCWSVGIDNPYCPGEILGEVQLKDSAMSTSGNMPSHPQHIVNPMTHEYITEHKLVTIIASDAVDAEVLSTVLMATDTEQAERIKQRFTIDYSRIFILPG